MNRRRFLLSATAIPLAGGGAIASPPAAPLRITAPSGLPIQEPFATRFQLTLQRVLNGTAPSYTPDFLLEDIHGTPGRRFTNFSGDVSGRWISGLATASSAYGLSLPALDEVVHRVIALQHPEGYFGKTFHFDSPDDDDLALLWGNGRLLVGLLEYHGLKGDLTVLASARRLGDFLLRLAPQFNSIEMANKFDAAHFASSYICWTQTTEGLAALYAATQDARYRDLCAEISRRIVRRPADHVHGYLCSLRGTLDLYNATHDGTHLHLVETAWREVMGSGDVLVTGGVPEAWSPNKKRTEGCAECDWLRLNLSLWHATGDSKYLEMAEHILFNEFAMNQFATGDFGHAHLNEIGVPALIDVRAWWCCTLHGLRAFPDVSRRVFRADGDALFYDLPLDASVRLPGFAAQSTSQLASDGSIRIRIIEAGAGRSLTIRKPAWADELRLKKNGLPIQGRTIAGIKAGDIIVASYQMSLTASTLSGLSPERRTFRYGPWLLGAASEPNPGYFNELQSRNILLPASAQRTSPAASSALGVPIAATTLICKPAEYPEQETKVNLRAVAEQTCWQPTRWEIAFFSSDKG